MEFRRKNINRNYYFWEQELTPHFSLENEKKRLDLQCSSEKDHLDFDYSSKKLYTSFHYSLKKNWLNFDYSLMRRKLKDPLEIQLLDSQHSLQIELLDSQCKSEKCRLDLECHLEKRYLDLLYASKKDNLDLIYAQIREKYFDSKNTSKRIAIKCFGEKHICHKCKELTTESNGKFMFLSGKEQFICYDCLFPILPNEAKEATKSKENNNSNQNPLLDNLSVDPKCEIIIISTHGKTSSSERMILLANDLQLFFTEKNIGTLAHIENDILYNTEETNITGAELFSIPIFTKNKDLQGRNNGVQNMTVSDGDIFKNSLDTKENIAEEIIINIDYYKYYSSSTVGAEGRIKEVMNLGNKNYDIISSSLIMSSGERSSKTQLSLFIQNERFESY